LRLAGIQPGQLSEPVTTLHTLPFQLQLATGARLETKMVIGASDGCLANLGSNAIQPGDVSLTIGTSGAVRMASAAPKYDPKSRIFNYVLTAELFISGGPINNGGVLLKWYSENFLYPESESPADFDSFVFKAASVEPGCRGLVFLPYVQGERAPVWDADAKGVFFGVTSVHTQAHFMRAIIEGICFSLRDVSDSLEETLGSINNVYASGGFVKSPAWVQILCDVLGKRIHITDTADASSIGAAMLAMYATGVITDLAEATRFLSVQKTYEPDLSDKEIYHKNFQVYRGLYQKLKDDF
jgi:gluconokinase